MNYPHIQSYFPLSLRSRPRPPLLNSQSKKNLSLPLLTNLNGTCPSRI